MTATAKIPAQRTTRRPTGLPSWPILLLAGGEKSGKSWSCAQASGSDLIGRTLWIGIGEDDPDEYGNVPGADFEIVAHDGTYRDILAAVEWATTQPPVDGKPTLVVLDSMTRLWDLLCDMAQDSANARAKAKAAKAHRPEPEGEADIHMDLWNVAKSRWAQIVDVLRDYQGPSLVTARLEEVAVVINGQPARDGSRTLKVKAEKSLPYDVGGIVQMPERGKAYLTGVRTTRMNVPERLPLPGFSVDKLWRDLGLADTEAGQRRHAKVATVSPLDLLLRQLAEAADAAGKPREVIAAEWATEHDGEAIRDTRDLDGLRKLINDLRGQQDADTSEPGTKTEELEDAR
jgi:hypothetical protein